MLKLYSVMAYDHDGNEIDPTNGEMFYAFSAKKAIEEAEWLAWKQGLNLKDFYITDVEAVFEGKSFKYYDVIDGIVVYTEDGEDIFFILDYGNEEDNKKHKKALKECQDLDTILSVFDKNCMIPLYLPENLREQWY